MSVVVKDCQNGKILLLSKGADEAILPYACAGKPSLLMLFVFLQEALEENYIDVQQGSSFQICVPYEKHDYFIVQL